MSTDADGKDAQRRLIDLTLDEDSAVVVLPLAAHNWLEVVASAGTGSDVTFDKVTAWHCIAEVATDGRGAPLATFEVTAYRRLGLQEAFLLDLTDEPC